MDASLNPIPNKQNEYSKEIKHLSQALVLHHPITPPLQCALPIIEEKKKEWESESDISYYGVGYC